MIDQRRFGRLKAIDYRDADYPMRMLTALEAPARTAPWQAPPAMDQGLTSACTGFGAAHVLASAPYMHAIAPSVAYQLYNWAQENDEWEGTDYDGSSVRGAVKGMVKAGLVKAGYWWAWDAETVRDYVRRYSAIIAGTDWYDGMMETDTRGYILPNGPMVGGHAFAILGFSDTREAFRIQNSWGQEWGEKGRAWITFEHFQWLLERDGGEAVAVAEVRPAA